MLGGVLGAAGFVPAVLGLVRGAPHLEGLLKDASDDGRVGGLSRLFGRV